MANFFSGDHPIVESIFTDASGSAVALLHSTSIADLNAQPAVLIAGYHSSSGGGYQVSMFSLDDQGRLNVNASVVPTGTTTVTGSVIVSNVVTVTTTGSLPVVVQGSTLVTGTVAIDRGDSFSNPIYVTGSITLTSGESALDPLFVTGTVGISGPVTSVVTGTVGLDRGQNSTNPLFVSGSVDVLNTVVVTTTGSLPVVVLGTTLVTGTVGISGPVTSFVTGTVGLDRGTSLANPLFISGSTAVSGLVTTREVVSTASTGSYILASTSVATILAANPNRRGVIIYNTSNKAMFVKFGSGASALDFTVKVFADDVYNVPVLYTGIMTALWAGPGPNGGAMVTETTP